MTVIFELVVNFGTDDEAVVHATRTVEEVATITVQGADVPLRLRSVAELGWDRELLVDLDELHEWVVDGDLDALDGLVIAAPLAPPSGRSRTRWSRSGPASCGRRIREPRSGGEPRMRSGPAFGRAPPAPFQGRSEGRARCRSATPTPRLNLSPGMLNSPGRQCRSHPRDSGIG
jgi:hypothetical protein